MPAKYHLLGKHGSGTALPRPSERPVYEQNGRQRCLAAVGSRRTLLRVAVVEVEAAQRQRVESTFQDCPGVELLGIFADPLTAREAIPAAQPDVVLIHIEPIIGVDTVQLAFALRRALPGVGVVLIADHPISSALSFLPKEERNGWTFILKDTVGDPVVLQRIMAASSEGLVVLDPEMVLPAEDAPNSGFARLTPKQLLTLQLIAEGLTNRAIAERLNVSVKAVENHINQIYQELAIDRRDPSIHPRVRAVHIYFSQHLDNPAARARAFAQITGYPVA